MKRTYLWPLTVLCSVVLISFALIGDTRLRGQNGDIVALSAEPSDSFVFELVIDGRVVAEYNECFGLGSSNEIEQTVVQTNGGTVKQKTPGALEWHDITLRHKGSPGADVWAWREAMETGKTHDAVRDGSLVMFKVGSAAPLAQWNFSKGWPASLTIEGSVQELIVVHEGVQRVTPSSYGSPKRR